MKKLFYIVCAAGLLLGGCAEPVFDDVVVPEADGTRTLTINTEIEEPAGTRALWNYSTGFAWESGNKLKVVGKKAYNSEEVVIDESNPGKGSFAVTVEKDETTFNAYMSRGKISYASGKVTFSVPAERDMNVSSDKYSLNADYILLASKGEFTLGEDNTVANVPFKLVAPLVCFRVYGSVSNAQIKSVAVTANDGVALGGEVVAYTLSDGSLAVSEGPTSTVKLNVTNIASLEKTLDKAKYVFLSLLPVETTNVTYTVTICDKTDTSLETVYRFTSDKGQEFVENTIYTLPLNLDNADKSEGVEITGLTVEDGGNAAPYKCYLGKTVTVAGKNLDKVNEIKFGDRVIENAEKSYGSVSFNVPEDFEFETATEMDITVDDFTQNVTVYPFYFYPNVTIGAQDASNRDKVFFVPDLGRVVSSDEFASYNGGGCLDPYIAANTQRANNSLNKDVITSADMYYSVPAYIFCTYSTNNKTFSLISPSNSATQIKSHKTTGNVALADGYGTPVVGYRNIEFNGNNSAEQASAAKVKEGTVTSVSDLLPKVISSGAPQYDGVGVENNRFNVGQVIAVQHLAYDNCGFGTSHTNAGGTAATLDDVYRGGLMYIKDVSTSEDLASKSTITFDFYWTKPIVKAE